MVTKLLPVFYQQRASVPSFPEKPLVFGGVGKGPLPLPTKIDERPGSASSQSTDSSSATSTSSKIGEDAKE